MVMKKKLIGALRKVADNPYLNLSAGMILILTAVVEIINSSEEASIGAHHGVLMFGILHAVTALPEILHGVDWCGINGRRNQKRASRWRLSCGRLCFL